MFKPQDFVAAQLYTNEKAVIEDALRYLLRAKPNLRLNLAIYLYQTEDISVAKAASLAGISWAQMRELLCERELQPRLGPMTIAEAEQEIQELQHFFEPNL